MIYLQKKETIKIVSSENSYVSISIGLEEGPHANLGGRFWNWKDSLESIGLKVSIRKTIVMVSGSEGELFKSKIDPCGVCWRKVMANSGLCTKCANWVHRKSAKIKRAIARLAMHFVCSNGRNGGFDQEVVQ